MAKPIVDGIERDLGDQAQVVRLSVMSGTGSRAAQRYGVKSIPTTIIFGGSGDVVSQIVCVPNRQDVVAQVLDLSK